MPGDDLGKIGYDLSKLGYLHGKRLGVQITRYQQAANAPCFEYHGQFGPPNWFIEFLIESLPVGMIFLTQSWGTDDETDALQVERKGAGCQVVHQDFPGASAVQVDLELRGLVVPAAVQEGMKQAAQVLANQHELGIAKEPRDDEDGNNGEGRTDGDEFVFQGHASQGTDDSEGQNRDTKARTTGTEKPRLSKQWCRWLRSVA